MEISFSLFLRFWLKIFPFAFVVSLLSAGVFGNPIFTALKYAVNIGKDRLYQSESHIFEDTYNYI